MDLTYGDAFGAVPESGGRQHRKHANQRASNVEKPRAAVFAHEQQLLAVGPPETHDSLIRAREAAAAARIVAREREFLDLAAGRIEDREASRAGVAAAQRHERGRASERLANHGDRAPVRSAAHVVSSEVELAPLGVHRVSLCGAS